MVTTQKQRIPWWWVFLITFPAAFYFYMDQMTFSSITFTIGRFTKDPALVAFLVSFNVAFSFLAAPFIAWKSDRIWTRFGRRRPFLIFGWIGLGASLIFMPLAPNIWVLGLVIACVQFCADITFQGTMQPLMWEVVPVPQRGRAAASWSWIGMALMLYSNFCLIGHFDDIYHTHLNLGFLGRPAITLTGEELIYWGTGLVFILLAFHMLWNIKEAPVHSPLIGERFHLRTFFSGIFAERQWLMLYMLIFSQIAMNLGQSQQNALMVTYQFHYSKAAFGSVMGWSMLLKLAMVVPLAGFLTDRFDRLTLFRFGMLFATVQAICYWTFIKFIAFHQIPARGWIIGFDVFGSSVDVIGNTALTPLFMDFVPRNRMGTVACGMTFARGLVKLLLMNFLGLWTSIFSRMFMPKGVYDYSSGLICMFILGIFGCMAGAYFAREVKLGKVIKYGLQDLVESEPEPPLVEVGAES